VYIEIGGHTDDIGSDEDNKKLSQERAAKVLNYLFGKGVEFYRMQAKGYGESEPLVPNTSDESRYMNRRVEFKIVKK
ncbi:MAG: OmpA family protein, partial [Opitutaceae bacterium]|nr:OmpA family protein [Cytophagales bacterium]